LTTFEYLLALVSILVGLAIADLALSLHRLLRMWKTVRWDWLPLASAFVVALLILNFWWAFYTIGHYEIWTYYISFLVLATYLICLFLLASAALPDHVPEGGIDLRDYYHAHHRYFWSLFSFSLLLVSVISVLPSIGRFSTTQIAISQIGNVVLLCICVSLIWTSNRRYHAVIVPLLFLVFLSQWYQSRLQQQEPIPSPVPSEALNADAGAFMLSEDVGEDFAIVAIHELPRRPCAGKHWR